MAFMNLVASGRRQTAFNFNFCISLANQPHQVAAKPTVPNTHLMPPIRHMVPPLSKGVDRFRTGDKIDLEGETNFPDFQKLIR